MAEGGAACPRKGQLRKVSFDSVGMGMKVRASVSCVHRCLMWPASPSLYTVQKRRRLLMQYKTEEVQRLVDAVEGKLYVVEGVVQTTATYGEHFRPITRFRYLQSLPNCTLICLCIAENLTAWQGRSHRYVIIVRCRNTG